MPFQCYTPRASLRSASIGGMFIFADGTRRVVPDHWLTEASLLEGGRLVRLIYTFCTIEVAGRRLDPIFEDASIGKLGAIQAASSKIFPDADLWVSSIVMIAAPAPPESPFRGEVPDA
jgi:hypothetical protein